MNKSSNVSYLPAKVASPTLHSASQTSKDLPGKEDSTGKLSSSWISVRHLQGLLKELNDVFEECKVIDWDGCGAEPITDAVYFNATKVISSLPVDLPIPTISPDNDGFVEFEWQNDRRNFSLYITDTNLILYAGFYNKEDRLSGRFKFENVFPERIKFLAKEVYKTI